MHYKFPQRKTAEIGKTSSSVKSHSGGDHNKDIRAHQRTPNSEIGQEESNQREKVRKSDLVLQHR